MNKIRAQAVHEKRLPLMTQDEYERLAHYQKNGRKVVYMGLEKSKSKRNKKLS